MEFIAKLSTIMLFASFLASIFVGVFAPSLFSLIVTSFSLINNILAIFPNFIGVLNMAYAYSLMLSVLAEPDSNTLKIGYRKNGNKISTKNLGDLLGKEVKEQNYKFLRTYKWIYSISLLVISAISFTLAITTF
ncbi:MAG: hypothetical protein ACFFE4_07635 [Candidatus Thorarchaeota archaeon]